MSQVDYIHFNDNIYWTVIQLIILYVFFCVIYVQIFYKILRLRYSVYFYILTMLNFVDFYIMFLWFLVKVIKIYYLYLLQECKFFINSLFYKKKIIWGFG